MREYLNAKNRAEKKVKELFKESSFLDKLSREFADTEYRIKNIYKEKIEEKLEEKFKEFKEQKNDIEKEKVLEQLKGLLIALEAFGDYNFQIFKKINDYNINDIEEYILNSEQPF